MFTVAVVGCGVMGLSTAVAIQRRLGPKVKVVIFTEKLSPETTGDVAAGVWNPFLLEDTPEESIHKWAKATRDYVIQLWRNGEAKEAGASFLPVTVVSDEENFRLPSWLKISVGHSELSPKLIKHYSEKYNKKITGGYSYVSPILEQSKFLPYLQRKFVENGGEVRIRRIGNFDELSDFDVIVNCTGVYSRVLVPDPSVYPVRGQIARIKAPFLYSGLIMETQRENFVFPNHDWAVLGGTFQKGDFNTDVDEGDKKFILDGCYKLMPALEKAPVIKHLVGLRPGRNQVRLELEYRRVGDKVMKIVHNYGHGGAGVTLSAGCALEASQLVKETLTRSKL